MISRKRAKKLGTRAEEGAQLDLAMEKISIACGELVARATQIARDIAKKHKQVSSPEVWERLWDIAKNDDDLRHQLEEADPRWMGVVFRHRQWFRVGWKASGSHKRPVSIWELQPELNV